MKPPTNEEKKCILNELKDLDKRLDQLEIKVEVQKEKLLQYQKELANIQDNTKWIRKTFVFLISSGAISVPASMVVGLL